MNARDLFAFPLAIPVDLDAEDGNVQQGMTLGDVFAAVAMHGLIARGWSAVDESHQREVAGLAFEMAAQMLKKRNAIAVEHLTSVKPRP